MANPWNINSIYELQYYNCPSCIFKNNSKQGIINHAYSCHPESIKFLSDINDGSLVDVSCPWNAVYVKVEDPQYSNVSQLDQQFQPKCSNENSIVHKIVTDIKIELPEEQIDPQYSNVFQLDKKSPPKYSNGNSTFDEIITNIKIEELEEQNVDSNKQNFVNSDTKIEKSNLEADFDTERPKMLEWVVVVWFYC